MMTSSGETNLFLYRLLQKLSSTSDRLPLPVKEWLRNFLSRQEVKCIGNNEISGLFLSRSERNNESEQIPEEYKIILQEALTEEMNSIKAQINKTVSILGDGYTWRDVNKLISANSTMEAQLQSEYSKIISGLEQYCKNVEDFKQAAEKYLRDVLLNKKNTEYDTLQLWLRAKSEALLEKARLIHGQLEENVFTRNTIRKLDEAKQEKQSVINMLEANISDVKDTLKSYSSLSGPTFDQLLNSYQTILKDLEDKYWALKQFGAPAGTDADGASSNRSHTESQ